MPVPKVDDSTRRLFGLHADIDLHHAGQAPQKVRSGDGEVVNPGVYRRLILGDGLGRLYLLLGNELPKFGPAIHDGLLASLGRAVAVDVDDDGHSHGKRKEQTSSSGTTH